MPIFFHTSFCPNIQVFKPFSHFGDLDSALLNVGRKAVDANIYDQAYLYEVEITFATNEKFDVSEDWGNPNSIALAMVLKNDLTGLPSTSMEKLRKELINRKIAGLEYNDYGFNRILAHLGQMKLAILGYNNIVEVGKQGSICVVDPARAKVLTSQPLTAAQTAKAIADYTALARSRPAIKVY